MICKKIVEYKSVRFEAMTREQLIEALEFSANEIERLTDEVHRVYWLCSKCKTINVSQRLTCYVCGAVNEKGN